MVKVGDRIRLSSMKGPDREGVVTAVTGSLVRVRWPSEEETTVIPAPGTLIVLAAGEAAPPRRRGRPENSPSEDEHRQHERGAQEEGGEQDRGGHASDALIGRAKGFR
jgi:hypothetical protein